MLDTGPRTKRMQGCSSDHPPNCSSQSSHKGSSAQASLRAPSFSSSVETDRPARGSSSPIRIPRHPGASIDTHVLRAGRSLVPRASDGDVVVTRLGTELGGGEQAGLQHLDGATLVVAVVAATVRDAAAVDLARSCRRPGHNAEGLATRATVAFRKVESSSLREFSARHHDTIRTVGVRAQTIMIASQPGSNVALIGGPVAASHVDSITPTWRVLACRLVRR